MRRRGRVASRRRVLSGAGLLLAKPLAGSDANFAAAQFCHSRPSCQLALPSATSAVQPTAGAGDARRCVSLVAWKGRFGLLR